MSEFSQLTYDCRDGVATITFNRPEVLNAFSRELYREVADAVLAADADPAADVIVLTGAGRAYGTGGDLKELLRLYAAEDRAGLALFASYPHRLFTTLEAANKAVIARVNGPAHAGALVTVLCSDLAVAADTATFRVPEALVGQADPFVATRLPLRLGQARAKLMMLTGQQIDAATAQAWGLINQAVPANRLDAAVADLVAALRQAGPEGRTLYKRLANAPLPPFDLAALRNCLFSPETREGAQAFAERRPAPWLRRG